LYRLITGEEDKIVTEQRHEATYMSGHPSTVAIPSIQSNYRSATIPHFNMYVSASEMDTRGVQGEYTRLLLGVDQDAASAVRKLHFDGVPNNEKI
jgi:hypothetical protein